MKEKNGTDVYIIPDTDATRELRWREETPWPAPDYTGTEVFQAAMVKVRIFKSALPQISI